MAWAPSNHPSSALLASPRVARVARSPFFSRVKGQLKSIQHGPGVTKGHAPLTPLHNQAALPPPATARCRHPRRVDCIDDQLKRRPDNVLRRSDYRVQIRDSKGLCTVIDAISPVSRQKQNVTPLGGGDLTVAKRDGALTAAHEPAESAAPRPLATTAQGARPRAVASAKGAPCEPVKPATTLPLATASQRLRGRPGRPRTKPRGDNPGDTREPQRTQVRVPPARQAARTQASPSCAPPGPRLLTRQQAADYLNLSSDMLDRLTQQGELPRVQLLLGNRNVRKVLYDRADLDRLVELSRVV